ncbi:hypothetical protein ABVN80_11275 [Acinetobacter baumannii]
MIFTKRLLQDGSRFIYSSLRQAGGFFPTGVHGFLAGFQIAIFAFRGSCPSLNNSCGN